MLAEDFIALKRKSWQRLSALIDRSQRGLANLSAEELQELGRLYRQITSDLAVARRDFPNHSVSTYLNNLVARGHGEVYKQKGVRIQQFLTFFTSTFPNTFRATWGYTFAAFLMFFAPAVISFIIAYRDPGMTTVLFPGMEDTLTDIQNGQEWWQSINDNGRTSSASLIMTNNIRVTFIAFAGGALLGVLTLYVLAQNGLMLGTIAGASQALDFADNLWGFVAAHGMIELSVIFIGGGAGLQLGWSVLRPGLLTRRAALVVAARRAVQLLFGCVPLLIVAGIIEGFISPADLPLTFKIVVSLGSGLLLYGYLTLAGRPADQSR